MPPSVFGQLADALATGWTAKARPEQLEPVGDTWSIWLVMAGRGFGKTRTGAEWVLEQVAQGKRRVALIGPTAADVRDVMVEGESGILACSPAWNRPQYEPSKRRLTWPSGAVATCYSADEPERLRGPQHDAAWGDEGGSWRYATEAWDMLQFGLRLGKRPRVLMTTTPRPTKLIKDLIAREGDDVVITRGRTQDNAANLAPSFLKTIVGRYLGTRLGRQELDGELLADVPGALWARDLLDALRVSEAPPLTRIVVALDPSVTSNEGSDETGLIAAGKGADGEAYVLADGSDRMAPAEWAKAAVRLFRIHGADRIVAEVNQGGDMVENTLRAVDPTIPFRAVHASRGKVTRAEPISALYEQGRVHHVGAFPALEDQMCAFTSDFDRSRAGYSPDRVDALVWALTELMGEGTAGAGLLEYYRRLAGDGIAPRAVPARDVVLFPPDGATSHVLLADGRMVGIDHDGSITLTAADAAPLLYAGWRCTDDAILKEGM